MLLLLAGALLVAIPLTILTTRNQQEIRSRASTGSTTLTFAPGSTDTSPIQKQTGESFPLDINIDPGTNLVTFVRLQVKYDPAKLALDASNPFVPNIAAFPVTIEGPVAAGDTLAISVSVGGDPTKAIQQVTKLGTLNFKAIGPTSGTPTQITFTDLSQALSSGTDDQASQNVLSSTTPANVIINADGSPTPTLNPPTPTPFASGCTAESINFFATLNGAEVVPPTDSTGTATININLTNASGIANSSTTVSNMQLDTITSLYIGSPAGPGQTATAKVILFNDPNGSFTSPFKHDSFTIDEVLNDMRNGKAYVALNTKKHPNGELRGQIVCIAKPTPVPTGQSTILQFKMLLHGVGSAGDNPNPQGSSLSNKNPLHPQRNFTVVVFDSNNQPIKDATESLHYDSGSGMFLSNVDLGPTFPTGNYNVKVKTDRYLRKLIPGIINIKSLQQNQVPQTGMVAGDIKDDNVLNVLDYNILRDCGYGLISPLPLADPNSTYSSDDCKGHNEFRPNSDIDDNGTINSADYNLFLRELSVQIGD